jgi:hypothetical protein
MGPPHLKIDDADEFADLASSSLAAACHVLHESDRENRNLVHRLNKNQNGYSTNVTAWWSEQLECRQGAGSICELTAEGLFLHTYVYFRIDRPYPIVPSMDSLDRYFGCPRRAGWLDPPQKNL